MEVYEREITSMSLRVFCFTWRPYVINMMQKHFLKGPNLNFSPLPLPPSPLFAAMHLTVEAIFIERQIFQKFRQRKVNSYVNFIDFKSAFGTM